MDLRQNGPMPKRFTPNGHAKMPEIVIKSTVETSMLFLRRYHNYSYRK